MRRVARSPAARAGAVVVVVIALDQLTKQLVRDSIPIGQTRHVLPGITLVHTYNQGVAFGILPGGGAAVSIVIGLALLALIVYFARNAHRPLVWLPTGMLIGGALGNIVDRVREGSVTDFIKLPDWPPFNVADSSITIGVVILAVLIETSARRARAAERNHESAAVG